MSACLSRLARIPVEIWITLAMATITLGLSQMLDLPIVLPSSQSASFVGIHYLLPILGILGWSIFAFFGQNHRRTWTFIIALPCYMLVLWAHFSLKLWAPLINPHLYDDTFWKVDQFLRPLINVMLQARVAMAGIFPIESNLYMIAFIAMFYISFSYHAIFTPLIFRNLFLAALLFQGLGAWLISPFLRWDRLFLNRVWIPGRRPLNSICCKRMPISLNRDESGWPHTVAGISPQVSPPCPRCTLAGHFCSSFSRGAMPGCWCPSTR